MSNWETIMNKEIIIDFSNNKSMIFKSISYATAIITNYFYDGIVVKGIHCSDTEDTQLLQDYLEGLNKSINT